MILEQINPRFRFGESNENFCDCAGLVIFYLKFRGKKCIWESEIKREATDWKDFYKQLTKHGFIKGHAIPKLLVATWINPDQTGHIGVYFEDKIYHMRPEGLQIKMYENENLWYYIRD
jgi:hypothetical protein